MTLVSSTKLYSFSINILAFLSAQFASAFFPLYLQNSPFTANNVNNAGPLVTKMSLIDLQGPGLVFDPVALSKSSSTFDSKSIGGPVVKRYIDASNGEEKWTLFYHGRSVDFEEDVLQLSTGRIGRAFSRDGIVWSKDTGSDFSENESILDVNSDDWWTFDTAHIGLGVSNSDIVRSASAMHYMYYFGGSFEEVDLEQYGLKNPSATGKVGIRTRIGVAVSQDGVNWGRVEGEHPSGCILDVGKENEFDSLYLHSPQVITTGSELYRLYYHSLDPTTKKNTVGLAISRDGFQFQKRGPVFSGGDQGSFDEFGASRRHVIFVDELDVYLMFYEALDGRNKHSIGLAASRDGFDWEKMFDKPIFTPSDPTSGYWDSGHVGSPYIVEMGGGVYRMYYVGSPQKLVHHLTPHLMRLGLQSVQQVISPIGEDCRSDG
eukprot:CAMPEP_0117762196 /NCGR_PEP_ID=MMETSP0947-20121206/17781_1 /TAXON_ID=44440 /ORGANISM="Chattonella subsalsa, Strain CCMP2191" /LENGTH=431 /DNA_ID=CAMNT_0005583431 /DNA_START=50 /DNA_END=1345 /DNA_ORIENTATION=-